MKHMKIFDSKDGLDGLTKFNEFVNTKMVKPLVALVIRPDGSEEVKYRGINTGGISVNSNTLNVNNKKLIIKG